MVCRTRPGGSASTSFAQQRTSLQTNEILSLSHELRHEGRHEPTPSRDEVAAWVDTTRADVQRAPELTDARRASIIRRLDQVADGPPPDGPEFHSWRHISQRAAMSDAALSAHMGTLAERLDTPEGDVRQRFDRLYREGDQRSNTLSAPAGWATLFRDDSTNGLLPADRGTMYALHQLNTEASNRPGAEPGESRPLRQPIGGSFIRSAGYDRATGRLDIEMDNGDQDPTVYCYEEVPSGVADEMMSDPDNAGRVYNQRIRGRYPSTGRFTSGSSADRQQCPDCGRFISGTHTCPTPGRHNQPPAGIAPTTGPPPGIGAPPSEQQVWESVVNPATPAPPEGPQEPTDDATPRLVMAPTRRVEGSNFAMVIPSRSQVRDFASEHPDFELPVQSQPDDGFALVDGAARIQRDPTNGYLHVSQGQLRCSCGRFSTDGTCNHMTGTIDAVEASINGRRGGASVANIEMAHEAAAGQLAADHAASRAGLAAVREPRPAISYTDNFPAFQGAYEAATLRQRHDEPVVPFSVTPDIAGLGESEGRGYGVEIEFAFPSTMGYNEQAEARRAIGRDLHDAGLTRTPHQLGYHGSGREAAAGLWSRWGFEADGSVTGGEVVSPVLYNREDDWEELNTVCQVVQRHGGTSDFTTGCHIHIGLGDYDHDHEHHNRLLDDFRRNEDTLYRLAQRPGATRHRMNSYSSPTPIEPTGYPTLNAIRAQQSGHDRGLNFGAVTGRGSDHVEFRLWDGSVDAGVIQSHVAISAGMVEAAYRSAPTAGEGSGPVGTHREARGGSRRRLTGEEWEADTLAFRQFADRVLPTTEARSQATALYAVNRWQTSPRGRY